MDDFGMLARDFGFRPQGKPAPMASSKANTGIESDGGDRRARSSSSSSFLDDPNSDGLLFSDVFGGPPKYTTTNTKSSSPLSDFDYDSVFKSSSAANDSKNKSSSSVPVYDKPVYDDDIDIFDGLPGLKSKSTSSSIRYDDDMFSSISSAPKQRDQFDDLLGNFGRTEQAELKSNKNSRGLDDLIPGFGVSSPTGSDRPISESSQPQKPTVSANHSTSNVMENPFVDFESTSSPLVSPPGVFTDPLEEISKPSNSGNTKVDGSSVSGGIFDDLDPLNGFGKSVPAYSFEMNKKDESPSRTRSSMNSKESVGKSSFKNSESHSQKKTPATNFQESPQGLFDMPAASPDSNESVSQTAASPFVNFNSNETNSQVDMSPRSEEHVEPTDDVWVTVSDIPLFTQPTSAPPPSRPPPPRPARASNARKKGNEFSSPSSSQYSQSPSLVRPAAKSSVVSQIDEFEEFVMGRTQNVDEYADVHSGDEMNTNSAAAASAAAMKDAMERAEAKFRHAKEVREREYVKAARTKEAVQLEKDEQAMQDAQERDFRENQERLEFEQRQREEEEREQRRLEKERERLREIEREREKARQAVERATREARERASVEARERAAAEARLKVERAAVQRAQAEARERAAVGAKERAEKTAAEARGRASAEATEKEAREKAAVARAEAEARRRAERAAVERATAEARERAAAEARERAAAAAAARTNQQKNDDDLESFFSMGSRPSSAPRPRANSSDPVDPQFQNRGGPDGSRRTSSVSVSSNIRKASSTTNIVDDLTSIFGAAPSYGEFQESEGENEERRRARLERHQRTQERAAKALAEKNQRDLQTQRDQEERHRISETLDSEIKRWAAGKEGNLRALLSTLQYVLWPECGWQPVSLTDLITGPSVKKAYRKATLCIHPDKVQQKGANIQQKYIAEKVFDLLKEAWNKFNSEELF
ncbi:hypothetical protein F0562_002177 [Nyssa sinensis]|uniref:J domain-containing protein n=1 Tax=Nyssa sinensis TaxID=561372 RepID=A0A5J5C517_9ASTE|nr:hypothetical protein F0562_002177 [Nyssa sinensis]